LVAAIEGVTAALTREHRPVGGLWVRRVDGGRAWAYEIKVDASKPTTRQAEIDAAVGAGRTSRATPAKGLEGKLPEIEDEIRFLRVPVLSLPRRELVADLSTTLSDKGVPQDVISDMIRRVDAAYDLDRSLRAAGRTDIAAKITVAAALGVTVVGGEEA
jgi:hypothetical protein